MSTTLYVDYFLKEIAEEYFRVYLQQGGEFSREEMISDFLIVACASVKDIPIVVSEDNATLANEFARKAYASVNKNKGITLPSFIRYNEFKCEILRTSSNPIVNSSNKFWIFLSFFNIFPLILFSLHTFTKESLIYKDFVLTNND